MKEELKRIKAINSEFNEKAREYNEARKGFNANIQNAFVSGDASDVAFFVGEDSKDFYEIAVNFYTIYEDLTKSAEELKAEHPRYGEKRFRDTLVANVIETKGLDYEEAYDEIYKEVTTYMLFEKNGYANVRSLELEAIELAKTVNSEVDTIVQKTGNAINEAGTKVFNAVKGVVSPYAEVAKGQYTTAKGAVKKKVKEMTNKGAKKAIGTLERIEKRTGSGE